MGGHRRRNFLLVFENLFLCFSAAYGVVGGGVYRVSKYRDGRIRK